MFRAALVCAVLLGGSDLLAQRLLLPVPRGETPPETMVIGDRITVPDVKPAVRSEAVTVLVLADLLTAEDRPGLMAELRRRWSALRQRDNLLVVVVRGSEPAPLAPARNFPALEKELLPLLEPVPEQAPAEVSAERLYDFLLGALPEEADAWREVVWAGRLPDLPEGILRDFARGRLARQLNQHRNILRVWPSEQPAWLPVAELPPDARLFEVNWPPEAAARGFEFRTITLDGVAHRYLAAAEGFRFPSLEQMSGLAAAVEAARRPEAGAAELARLRKSVDNYAEWPEASEAGAALAEKLNDPAAAAFFLDPLYKEKPDDPALLRRYALALAFSAPAASAEPFLEKALRAHPNDAALLERFGRAKLQRGDKPGAYRRFTESLRLQPDNTNLWWIAADLARDLNETSGEREALREALRREPGRIDRRARFIELALAAADGPEAKSALEAAEGSVPGEAPLLSQYASFWEKLSEPSRALPLWRRSVEADPGFEPGWLSVARLEMDGGRPAESLQASERGLAKLPQSPGLHAARVRALVAVGRVQEARRFLREATARLDDLSLTRQEAEVQDLFGGDAAAAAWDRYLERAREQKAPEREVAEARARAVRSALRDGQSARAAQLLGLPEKPPPTEQPKEQKTGIPGGVSALAYLSGIPGSKNPGRYLNDFARGVAQRAQLSQKEAWEQSVETLLDNYARLIQIRQLGKPVNGGAVILLQPGNKQERQRTQKVLELLGYRMKTSGGQLRIEAGVKKQQGRRQSLAAALDIDETGMEESLESGKPFEFRVTDDFTEVVLGEKAWAPLAARYGNSLGFAGLFLREPRAASLYAGLSSASPRAAEALQNKIGLKVLTENYADLLFNYGSALTMNARGECAVPGGPEAAAAWQQLAGFHPKQCPEFLDTLVRKDDGILLAYFATLHAVTSGRQRWFLKTPARARQFYDLMRGAPEWKNGAGQRVRKSPIVELFRTLPLTESGEVKFPGGPQVWQVGKGAGDLERVNKLAQKAERARPAEEEALLLRLAQQRYEAGNERFSQLENLLAVAQVEAALGRDLTPREALVLSQHFAEFDWAFPFFTSLPGLSDKEFSAFFSWTGNWTQGDQVETNLLLGIFESIVQLEGLLVRAGGLDGPASAEVFLRLCEGLRGAQTREAAAAAGLQALQRLREALRAGPGGLQAALESYYFGPADRALGRAGRKQYRAVLAAQKTPPVDEILGVLESLAEAAKGPAETREAAALLEKLLASLHIAAVPKGESVEARFRAQLESWNVRELPKIVREMREKAARKKPNPKDFPKLAAEARRELAPWLELSLRGVVQSFYLRPDDLPVSEDPLLLRKYQYRPLNSPDKRLFAPPEFVPASQGAGSMPVGSLAGMAEIAGRIATAGRQSSRGFAEAVEAKQLAALRNSLLWMVGDPAVRAVHLGVMAGREWLVDASESESETAALLEASEGLVSPERQAHLEQVLLTLQGFRAGKAVPDRETFSELWDDLWEQVSISDLYWLGRRRTGASPASLVFHTLARVPPEDHSGPVHNLGPLWLEHARSSQPRIAPLPAYEDYAAQMMPARLAERLSELGFALACAVDEAGLPAEALGLTAEPLARNLFESLSMADMKDFRSVLALWKRVDATAVKTLYETKLGETP